jgi:hypothetical protein
VDDIPPTTNTSSTGAGSRILLRGAGSDDDRAPSANLRVWTMPETGDAINSATNGRGGHAVEAFKNAGSGLIVTDANGRKLVAVPRRRSRCRGGPAGQCVLGTTPKAHIGGAGLHCEQRAARPARHGLCGGGEHHHPRQGGSLASPADITLGDDIDDGDALTSLSSLVAQSR